jgi:hypothetical protein
MTDTFVPVYPLWTWLSLLLRELQTQRLLLQMHDHCYRTTTVYLSEPLAGRTANKKLRKLHNMHTTKLKISVRYKQSKNKAVCLMIKALHSLKQQQPPTQKHSTTSQKTNTLKSESVFHSKNHLSDTHSMCHTT